MSNITSDITPSKGIGSAVKAAFRQPAFVVAVVILFIAALGLNGATQAMQLYFKKLPVPLARPLDQVPETLGKWVQVSHDEPLDHDVQEALNTTNFIFRNYVLEDATTRDEIPKFKDKTNKERLEILSKIQMRSPEKVMSLAVTYYTGLVDTVAHIPDRCYIADGYVPESYTKPTWKVKNKDGQDSEVQVRYINFEDKASRMDKKVAYFFHVNGHYEEDPLGVRRSLQNLFRKHGYYAKVELMTTVRDTEKSAAVMSDFLCAALPEVEKCLPDWNAIEGK